MRKQSILHGVVGSAVVLLAALLPGAAVSESSPEELERVVSELPRGIAGIPAQWFEMQSLVGWEKMMLVFGYADNKGVCDGLIRLAAVDSPDRSFRCTPAN